MKALLSKQWRAADFLSLETIKNFFGLTTQSLITSELFVSEDLLLWTEMFVKGYNAAFGTGEGKQRDNKAY